MFPGRHSEPHIYKLFYLTNGLDKIAGNISHQTVNQENNIACFTIVSIMSNRKQAQISLLKEGTDDVPQQFDCFPG